MNSQSSTNSDTVSNWIGVAVSYALLRGYSFDPDCLTDLFNFLRAGALQLQPHATEATTRLHYDTVEQLVSSMIVILNSQKPGESVLHEWTLIEAQTKLCPLFPFC